LYQCNLTLGSLPEVWLVPLPVHPVYNVSEMPNVLMLKQIVQNVTIVV